MWQYPISLDITPDIATEYCALGVVPQKTLLSFPDVPKMHTVTPLRSQKTDLYDRRPPNASACSATKSRTLIAGRPVTRSTPSAIRSYLPARFNAAIVTR